MNNRDFVQLAKNYSDQQIIGWFMSEKLDGMRALWDGGISRYKWCHEIPYANTAKDTTQRLATGLWSRYGKPIYAPEWFLDGLPDYPLDGELYLGPGQFQELVSITKRHEPDERWLDVKYAIFDLPSYEMFLMDGRINNPNFPEHIIQGISVPRPNTSKLREFRDVVALTDTAHWPSYVILLEQEEVNCIDEVYDKLSEVLNRGGEGLIVRAPRSIWTPKRMHTLLKIKPENDSEGTVIGYKLGVGKYEGMIGSITVHWRGLVFDLSGFNDLERTIEGTFDKNYNHPQFPLGTQITFKYRDLTRDGYPKEARYFRKML